MWQPLGLGCDCTYIGLCAMARHSNVPLDCVSLCTQTDALQDRTRTSAGGKAPSCSCEEG